MFGFSLILFLISPVAFLAGLVNPKWVLLGKNKTRLKSSAVYTSAFVASIVLAGFTAPAQSKKTSVPSPSASPSIASSPVVVPSVAASPPLAQSTTQALKQVSLRSSPVASILQTQSQFNFPKATCGDKPSGEKDTWYPIFVDGGDLETIRRNFCADATSTVRKDSQVQSVQVGSFTSRDRASLFAKAVGGDVGQPTHPDVASSEPQPQVEAGGSTSLGSNEAVLAANDPDSQINLRNSPSLTGKDLGYGVVGDRVQIIEQISTDGYTWHKVRFPRSGAVGWIRGDFVSVVSASKTSQPTYSSSSEVTSNAATYYTPTVATSGGSCSSPDDLDSRGHRCGGRVAGGRASRGRHRR
jgi:hypothetical protein